ncbi:MAG: tetratricopeptide repeat protein [Candidatus Omnitrophota bacterium]
MSRVIKVISILSLVFIFPSLGNGAWWRQKPEAEEVIEAPKISEEVEDEIRQSINKQFEDRINELETQNRALTEDKIGLESKLESLSQERENLLKKLKDYTAQRESLNARITVLEAGIINLNDMKNKLAEDKVLLSAQIEDLQKEIEPVNEVREKLNKKIAEAKKICEERLNETIEKENKKYRKQIDKLNNNVSGLEEDKKNFVRENDTLQKELKKAMEEFSDTKAYLEKLKREAALMHYNLGVIFDEAEKYNKAISEYMKVLEVKPDDAETHYNLAVIYDIHKNNRPKAIYHYKMYLKIRPDAEDAAKVKEWVTERELQEQVWKKENSI